MVVDGIVPYSPRAMGRKWAICSRGMQMPQHSSPCQYPVPLTSVSASQSVCLTPHVMELQLIKISRCHLCQPSHPQTTPQWPRAQLVRVPRHQTVTVRLPTIPALLYGMLWHSCGRTLAIVCGWNMGDVRSHPLNGGNCLMKLANACVTALQGALVNEVELAPISPASAISPVAILTTPHHPQSLICAKPSHARMVALAPVKPTATRVIVLLGTLAYNARQVVPILSRMMSPVPRPSLLFLERGFGTFAICSMVAACQRKVNRICHWCQLLLFAVWGCKCPAFTAAAHCPTHCHRHQ